MILVSYSHKMVKNVNKSNNFSGNMMKPPQFSREKLEKIVLNHATSQTHY